MSKMKSAQERIDYTERLMGNPKAKEGWIVSELQAYRLHLELTAWIDAADHDSAEVRDRYTVSIIRLVKTLYALPALSADILRNVASVLMALGFQAYIPYFEECFVDTAVDNERKLSFGFVKLIRSKGSSVHKFMEIRENPVLWQLRLFGEYMDRSMDSSFDRRVQFEPDAWQKKVLDCCDDPNHSILVVGEHHTS
jgi:hypothetical protein